MNQRPESPAIKLWQLPGVDGVEFIRATAITQPLPKQFHEEFVLGAMERGGHEMLYRGTTYTAAPGSLILTQPGEVTTCGPSSGQGRTFRAIHLPPQVVYDVASALVERPGQTPYFSNLLVPTTYFTTWFLRIHRRLEAPTTALERVSLLQNLLARLIMAYASPSASLPPPTPQRHLIQQARDYLHAHYADEISLADLARVTSLSAFHLNHMFRHIVGMPPHAYQVNVRVEHAKALLAQGVPIPQVALQVGFFDQSHLTYHFKRLLGYTPGTYQRNVVQQRKNFQDAST
jgi:AraC-like DNA-binding protein